MNVALSADGRALTLSGPLSEKDDLTRLAAQLSGEVRVDVGGVGRINSAGVKGWMSFVAALPDSVQLVFERCPAGFVSQLNMVAGFIGKGRVASVAVPYTCPSCGESADPIVSVSPLRDLPATHGPCPRCGAMLELDVSPDEFLAFLQG
ncbi:MAG: hypothetical protein IPJ65_21085 [Archangiaceae bacterium]|nr:hypothetical protein [Archangiaceae bacterium]